MKYRIKIIVYKNGRVEYIPQKKLGFFWLGIDYKGEVDFIPLSDYPRDSRDEALKVIDKNFEANCKKESIMFQYIK